ncbi:MAG: alpha/beta hydrolase [Acutalibacteraceae bacterium]|nr:alpha/beta hydrolase [Acutalibacteraceae bacterium]
MSYQLQVALTVFIVLAVLFLILYVGLGFVFFFIALGNKKRPDPKVPCKDSLFERNADNPNLIAGYKWYDNTYHQEVIIKNRKGENLHGVEFRNPSNSNVWAVCLHGWTNVNREMSSYAMEFYKRGFNVLLPDLRGHNNSEHKFVTMGWLDRLDVVDWINNIVEENPKARIIIHGVSMGGATTMMTTGEELPENVVVAIEDCGFTSVKDIFVDQCIRKYHLPPKIVIPQATMVNKLMNGFFFGEASAVEQVKKSKTPTLFMHGDKDSFVLPGNLDPVYEACAAPKEKYIIKGAEHAVSSHWCHEEYWEVVDAFLEKYFYTSK